MYYIIAIIIVCVIIYYIFKLIKYILFHPIVNGVITIIALLILSIVNGVFVLAILPIIDCLRDIKLSDKIYNYNSDPDELEIDSFFAVKSILSVLTLGQARVIYFVIVYPLIKLRTKSKMKNDIKNNGYVRFVCSYNGQLAKYYYQKNLDKMLNTGTWRTNQEYVYSERKKSAEKLEKLYPRKILAKIADQFSGDAEMKYNRSYAQKVLDRNDDFYCICIPSEDWLRFTQLVVDNMANRGPMSAIHIARFSDFKELRFVDRQTDDNLQTLTYLIVSVLEPLVLSGEFNSFDFNDNDPLDNHSYQYARSTVEMKSIDGDNNPLLALDD